MPTAVVEAFHNHYAAQGWVTGAGQPIRSLAHALAKWKAQQAEHPSKVKAKPANFREVIHA